jgi:hypothetical protein
MSFLEGLGADATLLDVRVQLSLLSLSARRVDLRRWQTCLVVLPIPAAAASARTPSIEAEDELVEVGLQVPLAQAGAAAVGSGRKPGSARQEQGGNDAASITRSRRLRTRLAQETV